VRLRLVPAWLGFTIEGKLRTGSYALWRVVAALKSSLFYKSIDCFLIDPDVSDVRKVDLNLLADVNTRVRDHEL
jgi:hypothetical protein